MSELSKIPGPSTDLSTVAPLELATARSKNGPPRKSEQQQVITAGFVLHAMRQWWKVAFPVGLILAGIAAGTVYMLFEPTYKASSWLQILERPPTLVYSSGEGSQGFVNTQVQLIRSPLVLGPVISLPEIADLPEVKGQADPIQWLKNHISVQSVGGSELFTISFAGPKPESAAIIANAVTDTFFNQRRDKDAKQTQRIIELLDEEWERRRTEVETLRENVRELTKQATGRDPFGPIQSPEWPIGNPLANLQRDLNNTVVEEEFLKAEIQAYEEIIGGQEIAIPDGTVENSVENHPEIIQRKQAIAAQQAKLHEIDRRAAKGKKDPFYLDLAGEIETDEAALETLRQELWPKVKEELETNLALSRKTELEDMKSRLDGYTRMREFLQKRYDDQLKDRKEYSGETLTLEFKRAELGRAEEVLDLMATRASRLRTEQRAPDRVTRLKEAEIPSLPVELVPYKKMSMAGLAVFCIPFVLAVLWERVVRRISTSEQLERNSNLTVVGEIARLPMRTRTNRSLATGRAGQGLKVFEESIDGLRTGLMLSESLQDVKVLAVTSASNREGKTSVASQLAVSIARALNQPTLLIDGDVRSPDVHNVFEIPLGPGLVEVLSDQASLEDAVVTSWSKYVHLLPAGKLHISPHKLFGNGALRSVLDELRPSYRYIIIDTPSVLSASEALVLAKAADASLMCAMRDSSRASQVRMAYERLVAAGSHPVGTVLNGVPASSYAYRYGSYAYSRD